MKKFSLLLLLSGSLHITCDAQSGEQNLPPYKQNPGVSLAGDTGNTIQIRQIEETPVVTVADPRKKITSFDFSWTIKTESGSEFEGPYHNVGDKLNATSLAAIHSDAAKGIVTRIYIDEVNVTNSDGTMERYKGGAAYKVVR